MILLTALLSLSLPQPSSSLGFGLTLLTQPGQLNSDDTPCDNGTLSCEGRCDDSKHLPCSCDTVCVHYGDCCFDYKDVCTPPGERNMMTPGKCYTLFESKQRLVNSCPENYEHADIAEKCITPSSQNPRTLFEDIPFMDGKTKVSYRNRFCALCNNASDITGWDMHMQCVNVHPFNLGLQDLLHKIKSGACLGTPSRPTAAPPRPCITGAVQQCPSDTDAQLLDQCKAYTSYVKTYKPRLIKYANLHCLRCNNVNEEDCLAMTDAEDGRTVPLIHNLYDSATLVWNPTMETWSLSFLSTDQEHVYSDLLVCQLGETSHGSCLSSPSSPTSFKSHFPMTIVAYFQTINLNTMHDDTTAKFLDSNLFRKPPGNYSWIMLGHFILRSLHGSSEQYTSTAYFFNTERRLDYLTKRDLIEDIRRSVTAFHQHHYPTTQVILIVRINDYHGIESRNEDVKLNFMLEPVGHKRLWYAERMMDNSGPRVTCTLLSVMVCLHLLLPQ